MILPRNQPFCIPTDSHTVQRMQPNVIHWEIEIHLACYFYYYKNSWVLSLKVWNWYCLILVIHEIRKSWEVIYRLCSCGKFLVELDRVIIRSLNKFGYIHLLHVPELIFFQYRRFFKTYPQQEWWDWEKPLFGAEGNTLTSLPAVAVMHEVHVPCP